MSVVNDTHEITCSCNFPFAHLLSIIFPLGHTDRDKTIEQILQRDYKEKCRSSGGGDASFGGAEAAGAPTEINIEKRGGPEEEDIAALLAAVEEDDAR